MRWPRIFGVWSKRCLGLAAGLSLLVLLALAFAARRAMTWEGDDPYNRTEGWAFIERSVLRRAGAAATEICRCVGERELVLRQEGGFETRATLYGLGDGTPRPGVVIVHGNTALGRRLSTYRLLAERLAERGFLVLTYDQLGFGESDDPYGRGREAARHAMSGAPMLGAAIEALLAAGAEPGTVTLLGHSGGAIPVLQLTGHQDVERLVRHLVSFPY